jgi:cysteine desulfurase/selenocysteine lyase
MSDFTALRKDFPILGRTIHGKRLVYLDNAATSQKPSQVIKAIVDYYEGYNSNVHRGVHSLSGEATARYEEAREKVARFINAPSAECIVWTRNTTEAINLVAHSWAMTTLSEGDEIVITEMEHHSNLVPWQRVCETTGAKLKLIPVSDDGLLDLSGLDEIITARTRLVAAIHVSNVLGTINPVRRLAQAAHRVGSLFLADAAQSVPHMPVDVQEMDCDFLAFSSHKMMGPTGIGVLYIKPNVINDLEPFLRGGEMVREVWYDHATWNDVPLRFEAGTPNIADAIALGVAVDYLQDLGMDEIRTHEKQLTEYALESMKPFEEVTVFGPSDPNVRGGVVAFDVAGIHPHDIGTLLDHDGVAIRTGHHCAMPLTRDRLGLASTARASFYVYNTEEEIDLFLASLRRAIQYFKV